MSESMTAQQLADHLGAKLVGNPELKITGVAPLELAGPSDASFLANPLYNDMMKKSAAGLVCVRKDAGKVEGHTYLITEDPSATFQKVAELFIKIDPTNTGFEGVHSTAVIHPTAKVHTTAHIGPGVVICANTTIGAHCHILGSAFIAHNVKIGSHTTIFPNVTVREECVIGQRVIIQPGAVIGSCGFGLTTGSNQQHKKLDQIGNVIIEDDVEIGANTTIDRARFKTTLIKQGTKIDNLVQIGHNVEVGKNTIIVSQTGIAGSSIVGDNVIIGGQVGIAGHLKITHGVQIASQAGVSKNLDKPGPYRGSPAMPMEKFNKQAILVRRLEKWYKKVNELEEVLLKKD